MATFDQARLRRVSLGLGLRYGLLIGLALALGTWLPHALVLRTTHVRLLYPPLILGTLVLMLLGGLAGRLAAQFESALIGGVIWAVMAVLMTLIVAHVPYEGRTLVVWLVDRRFWGLPIAPFTDIAKIGLWMAGFFIVALIAVLGFLQNYRLDGLRTEIGPHGRLSGYAWFKLALPMPLIIVAGLIADNIINSPLRTPIQLVDKAIRVVRTYPGDLFELSKDEGVNYNALVGVRDQLGGPYQQFIGEMEAESDTLLIVSHFDNGAWIACWVVGGNLSYCYEAGPPYYSGFPALLTRGETPPDCQNCKLRVDDALRTWLMSQGSRFDETPYVARLAQRGNYVLMRAQTAGGDDAIDCRFHGIREIVVEACWEVEGTVKAIQDQDGVKSSAITTVSLPTSTLPTGLVATNAAATSPATADTPTTAARATLTPASPADARLAPFAAAMRPAFVEDLTSLGPLSRYDLEVTIDPERSQVSGAQTIHYVNTSPSSQEAIYLRLFPNLPSYGGQMTVDNLHVDDEAVRGKLEVQRTALRVPLVAPLAPGDETTITLDFEVTVPITTGEGYGQFIFDRDVMALANFFPLIPAYDEENCAHFGRCVQGWNVEYTVPHGDAVFSETSLFDVRVTVPSTWTVVASGSTVAQEPGPGETVTWHIVSGPMRDFNLVLSPRFEVVTKQVADIVVNSYYLPEDAAGGERVLSWVVDALDFFDRQLGPYPFAEFDAVATPTVAGGIEYPGLIAMPIRNYGQTGGFFQWATVHEVAHQWWYSLVGNDQQDEPWLDEALTQYSTALYYELRIQWDGAIKEVFQSNYDSLAGTQEDDLISLPVSAYSASNYGPVVYSKGPLFFHALRNETGYKVFNAMLRQYFDTFRYRVASGPDFLSLAEEVAEEDLSELYREWLGETYSGE